MRRFRSIDASRIMFALALIAQSVIGAMIPSTLHAQSTTLPENVVLFGECHRQLQQQLKLSVGTKPWLPLLPDTAAAEILAKVTRGVSAFRPAVAPPPPPEASTDGVMRTALRSALTDRDAGFAIHLTHVRRLKGQADTLADATQAAMRIGRLEQAQQAALAASVYPNWVDTATMNASLGDCAGSYMESVIAHGRVRLWTQHHAFAYGEEMRRIEAVLEPRSVQVSAEIPVWAAPGCLPAWTQSLCKIDRRYAVPGLYLGDEPAQRRQRERLRPEMLEAFHVALVDAIDTFGVTRSRLLGAYAHDRASLLPAVSSHAATLAAEQKGLARWKAELDQEELQLVDLLARIAATGAAIAELDRRQVAAADLGAAARAAAEAARLREAESRIALHDARDGVALARQRKDAVELACNGQDYARCLDAAARARYDELLFKAYVALTEAQVREWAARDDLDAALDARFAADTALADLRDMQSVLRDERGEQRVTLLDLEEDEAQRRGRWNADAAAWRRVDGEHREASEVISTLLALLEPEIGKSGAE